MIYVLIFCGMQFKDKEKSAQASVATSSALRWTPSWLVRYPVPPGCPLGITVCVLCLTHMGFGDSQAGGYDIPSLGSPGSYQNSKKVRSGHNLYPYYIWIIWIISHISGYEILLLFIIIIHNNTLQLSILLWIISCVLCPQLIFPLLTDCSGRK